MKSDNNRKPKAISTMRCGNALQEPADAAFWDDQYQSQTLGWDLGSVSPPLADFIDQLQDKDLRILIPGCGNSYEAEYLLKKGFSNITLLDISPTLVQGLREKFSGYSGTNILLEDFFEHQGEYDLILEQTFFCALPPSLRPAYVLKMHDLLKPDGRLAGVLFDREFQQAGPPFGGTREEYQNLFAPHFHLKTFEACRNSVKPRQGSELFINHVRK